MKQIQTKAITFLMTFALTLILLPGNALAEGSAPSITDCKENLIAKPEQKLEKPDPEPEPESKTPPSPASCGANFGYDFKITFNDSKWLSSVTGVSVAGNSYTAVESSYSVWNNTSYYVDIQNSCILIGEGGEFKEGKASCIIDADGYDDLTITLDKDNHSISDAGEDGNSGTDPDPDTPDPGTDPDNPDPAPQPPVEGNKKPAPAVTAKMSTGFDSYRILTIQEADGYVNGITELSVNDTPWTETTSKAALFNAGSYYRNTESNQIFFASYTGIFTKGDKIIVKHADYEDLVLSVTVSDSNTFQAEPYNPSAPVTQDQLHIRLVGYFEAALKGQLKYDAISGASTSVSVNQNSNVTVQVASLPEGQMPEESDWKTLDTDSGITINPDKSKTFVTIQPKDGETESSGMAGVYSPYDGSLTLAGTPATPGAYEVQVTFTDAMGRTATSNSLPFLIYEGNETLSDCLKLEHATQTADGKYMYDMEPWTIKYFGGDEKVTVPAEIKAWYGSHKSGTYGELGYAVTDRIPRQTLTVPAGCNLTLVNMKILSSVRIVVENGGKLTLRDSSIFGVIEVNNGGTFSMNYDDYSDGGKFLTGASMNGQLILNDGAALANASIYSNTNNLTDSGQARKNMEPVVVVKGTVNVSGQVFIKGDGAPTGTDPATGKSYAGQAALKVESGGTLIIPEGAALAAYGGGQDAATSVGGTALILDGTVTGQGTLIAVGGSGTFDDGGNAVSGSGVLSPSSVYLEGGSAFMPKYESITAGRAMADTVTLSDTTNRTLKDGARKTDNYGNVVSPAYWTDITKVPDVTALYQIDANAPGQQKPEQPETNPGSSGQKPGNTTENSGDSGNTGTTPAGNGSQTTGTNSTHSSKSGHTPPENNGQHNENSGNAGTDTQKADSPTEETLTPKTDTDTESPSLLSQENPAQNTILTNKQQDNITIKQEEDQTHASAEISAKENGTPESEAETTPESEAFQQLEDEAVPLSGNLNAHTQGNPALKVFTGIFILLLAAAGILYWYVRRRRNEAR